MLQHRAFGSLRDDPAVASEQQVSGLRRKLVGTIGDDQHRPAGAHQSVNNRFQAKSRRQIEAAERVVEYQKPRQPQQGVDKEHLALLAVGKGDQLPAKQGFDAQPAAESPAVFPKLARVALAGTDFKRVDVLNAGLRKELRHGLPAFGDAAVPA